MNPVKPELHSKWLELYVDELWIKREIAKADAWLLSNPKRQKKNMSRFYNNWLNSAFEYNPPTGKKVVASTPAPLLPEYDENNAAKVREIAANLFKGIR